MLLLAGDQQELLLLWKIDAPAVIKDDVVFSEGHVPIIKKLYSSIQESLK